MNGPRAADVRLGDIPGRFSESHDPVTITSERQYQDGIAGRLDPPCYVPITFGKDVTRRGE